VTYDLERLMTMEGIERVEAGTGAFAGAIIDNMKTSARVA
jgi:hypothetical protein